MRLTYWRIFCSSWWKSVVYKAFFQILLFPFFFSFGFGWHVKRKHFDLTKIHSHLNISSSSYFNIQPWLLFIFEMMQMAATSFQDFFFFFFGFSESWEMLDMATKFSSSVKSMHQKRWLEGKGLWNQHEKKEDKWKMCNLAESIFPFPTFFFSPLPSPLWERQWKLTLYALDSM